MEHSTMKPTEIICWPERMEFGGIVWRRREVNKSIEFDGFQPGVGRVRVYLYPDDGYQSAARWYAANELDGLLKGDSRPEFIRGNASTICDTVEAAMQFCLDARVCAQKDLQKMLLALGVGDPYSVGFRDGQSDIKQKLAEVLQ